MPYFHTHNPYTLEQVSIYKKDDITSLKTKVSHANTASEKWRRVNITKRIELLRRSLSYVAINRDEIAGSITAEMGKPLNQSYNELKSFFERHLALGGKDGAYVAADTNPISAAEALVDGVMYNAGQSCCGIERLYEHEGNHESFINKCRELIEDYRLGDPMEGNCDMGPLGLLKGAGLMER